MNKKYISVDTLKYRSSNPFNSSFSLDIPIINKIKDIELLNLQLPIGFYNIRDNCNTFYFKQGSYIVTGKQMN